MFGGHRAAASVSRPKDLDGETASGASSHGGDAWDSSSDPYARVCAAVPVLHREAIALGLPSTISQAGRGTTLCLGRATSTWVRQMAVGRLPGSTQRQWCSAMSRRM